MTIDEFLTAQLDKDEQVALTSITVHAEAGVDESTWEVDELVPDDREPYEVVIYPERGGSVTVARTWRTEFGRVDAEHIARHDPARVLAEVAAKRAIVAAYVEAASATDTASWQRSVAFGAAVRILCAVYADRPDYDPAWADH